jgi:SAM-dependent methyltransferase
VNEAVRERWEARYRACPAAPASPCRVLAEHAHLLPRTGAALDLACGTGGNALFLARRGLTVSAWDIAPSAIARLEARAHSEEVVVQTAVRDIETLQWGDWHFDVIVVSRYLERTLSDHLCRALNPGGLLFYQTFTAAKLSDAGPRNPAYLLADNELLSLFGALRVRYYREDSRCGDLSAGERDEAYFIGQKGEARP